MTITEADQWGYRYKGAWSEFAHSDPPLAAHCMALVTTKIRSSPDPFLSDPSWIEAEALRIAWLCGLVEFDW